MADLTLQNLLEAGVHFGHQTRRWNPKMRRFIFAERSGIYLIDLQKTLIQIKLAQDLMREVVLRGDGVLFVCTKRQLKQVVRAEAERCDSFFVTERWLGGTLTNFQTIKKQIRRLKEIEQGQEEGAFEFFTKKERLRIDRERQKLVRNVEGIKQMSRLPAALFVVDAQREKIAIAEARKLNIAVVAIVDTNADPDVTAVPIPGNDDAIRSVALLTGAVVDVIAEARSQVPVREVTEDSEAFTYSTEAAGQGDVEEHRKRRRAKRKRRPKPEAIVARLKEGEAASEGQAAETDVEGQAAETDSEAKAAGPDAVSAEGDAPAAAPAVVEASGEDKA
ncbi:MAG: 30S ribosomal protein S2 [Gemmatimonadetes bacterium]|nr:30S ribosomal protein S2 [Gemmatimonadota bacterium]